MNRSITFVKYRFSNNSVPYFCVSSRCRHEFCFLSPCFAIIADSLASIGLVHQLPNCVLKLSHLDGNIRTSARVVLVCGTGNQPLRYTNTFWTKSSFWNNRSISISQKTPVLAYSSKDASCFALACAFHAEDDSVSKSIASSSRR